MKYKHLNLTLEERAMMICGAGIIFYSFSHQEFTKKFEEYILEHLKEVEENYKKLI